MGIGIIIPSDCPDEQLFRLIDQLNAREDIRVLVVDDGCEGDIVYSRILSQIGERGCTVLHHRHRLGKGAAIKTGIEYVTGHCPEVTGIVTADEDGQFPAEDIFKACDQLEQEKEGIILGTRNLKHHQEPYLIRLKNLMLSLYFRMSTGIACSDVYSSLRGIPRKYFDLALSVDGDGRDFGPLFLEKAVKGRIPIVFLPSH